MGLKKVSFYQISTGPDRTVDIEPVPITFNPALENWAFSVALTRIAITLENPFPAPSVSAAAASVFVTSERSSDALATHGTSEEYGRLISLQLGVVAEYGIAVDALLTVYEYETEFVRGVRAVEVEPPRFDPEAFGA